MNYRVISDEPIDFGRIKRRRVRVLLEKGASVKLQGVRDLAKLIGRRALEKHGNQHAIAVMFYDDIFTPLGALGSWDWCPGGVWGDAHKAKSGDYSHHRWVLDTSALMPAEIIRQLVNR